MSIYNTFPFLCKSFGFHILTILQSINVIVTQKASFPIQWRITNGNRSDYIIRNIYLYSINTLDM